MRPGKPLTAVERELQEQTDSDTAEADRVFAKGLEALTQRPSRGGGLLKNEFTIFARSLRHQNDTPRAPETSCVRHTTFQEHVACHFVPRSTADRGGVPPLEEDVGVFGLCPVYSGGGRRRVSRESGGPDRGVFGKTVSFGQRVARNGIKTTSRTTRPSQSHKLYGGRVVVWVGRVGLGVSDRDQQFDRRGRSN